MSCSKKIEKGKKSPRGANPEKLSGVKPSSESKPSLEATWARIAELNAKLEMIIPLARTRTDLGEPVISKKYPYFDLITKQLRSTPVNQRDVQIACRLASGATANYVEKLCPWVAVRADKLETNSQVKVIPAVAVKSGFLRSCGPSACCMSCPNCEHHVSQNAGADDKVKVYKEKSSKFANSNLVKATLAVSAGSYSVLSSEPEPSVGSTLPSQYSIGGRDYYYGTTIPVPPPLSPAEPYVSGKSYRRILLSNDALEKQISNMKSETFKKFGHIFPGPTQLQEEVESVMEQVDCEGKPVAGTTLLGYRERRTIIVSMRDTSVPILDFVGLWNDARVAGNGAMWVNHFGVHFHARDIVVSLPATCENEMKSWWRGKEYNLSNFLLSVAYCRTLLSTVILTSKELDDAVLYLPILGFVNSFASSQNGYRYAFGAYLKGSIVNSYKMTCKALETTQGKVIVGGAALLLGTTLVFGAKIPAFYCIKWSVGAIKRMSGWSILGASYLLPLGVSSVRIASEL